MLAVKVLQSEITFQLEKTFKNKSERIREHQHITCARGGGGSDQE